MKTKNSLLQKYYKGETSLEEEKQLKKQLLDSNKSTAEKDVFEYYESKNIVPDNLEEDIFDVVQNHQKKKKSVQRWLYSATASAAAVLIFITLYFNFQTQKNNQLETEFFVMEQALMQVSESIQPPEQEEMLVLWVDDDVEIIIN